MSMELIHTSAPQGIRPGSRGFCTVAMTRGLPANLVERLESLSGYRFWFDASGPDAGLNRPAFSHMAVTLGGRSWSIVSRIAPTTPDYSGRTNKIAHHLVLDVSELPAAGPAWLLSQPSVFRDAWTGTPGLIESPPSVPAGHAGPMACATWASVAGDAGWAGELLRVWRERRKGAVFVLVPPGADAIRMVAEALSLLPESERWDATFTTCAAGDVPPDVRCQVRFLPAVPDASRMARSTVNAMVMDLTKPGPAPESVYATATRAGRPLEPQQVAIPSVRAPQPANVRPSAPLPSAAQVPSQPPPVPDVHRREPPVPWRDQSTIVYQDVPGQRPWGWVVVAASIAMLLGAVLGVFLSPVIGKRSEGASSPAPTQGKSDEKALETKRPSDGVPSAASAVEVQLKQELGDLQAKLDGKSKELDAKGAELTIERDLFNNYKLAHPDIATTAQSAESSVSAESIHWVSGGGSSQIGIAMNIDPENLSALVPVGWKPTERLSYAIVQGVGFSVEPAKPESYQLEVSWKGAQDLGPAKHGRLAFVNDPGRGWTCRLSWKAKEDAVPSASLAGLRLAVANGGGDGVRISFEPEKAISVDLQQTDSGSWTGTASAPVHLDPSTLEDGWRAAPPARKSDAQKSQVVQREIVQGQLKGRAEIEIDERGSKISLSISPFDAPENGQTPQTAQQLAEKVRQVCTSLNNVKKQSPPGTPPTADITTLNEVVAALEVATRRKTLADAFLSELKDNTVTVRDNGGRTLLIIHLRSK